MSYDTFLLNITCPGQSTGTALYTRSRALLGCSGCPMSKSIFGAVIIGARWRPDEPLADTTVRTYE